MKTIDVGAVIDESRWTGYQKLLVLGTALAIILDGIDNQLLPNAIPDLMRDWQLERGPFVKVLALGPFGMMLGVPREGCSATASVVDGPCSAAF